MLETLFEQTLSMMNEGAKLNDIQHSVKLPDTLLARPCKQGVGQLHAVLDVIEFCALVHHGKRLLEQGFEQLGTVPQRLMDPVATQDRRARRSWVATGSIRRWGTVPSCSKPCSSRRFP